MTMSLQNLVGVSLDPIAPAQATVARLLAAAKRQIADAQSAAISTETRFAAAYTAIRMLADAALNANGYRTLTSRPGHHQTAIQTLPLTMGVPAQTVQVLDALRKQRHLTEYSGDLIPDSALQEAVLQANALLAWTHGWLRREHPELL
ncbi:hypothetical protein BURC_02895 [Burkholderiaceae bacterium]|nr:hypothetical protein BURC_02895 [Burkholderiaceae bacterium]